RRHRAAERGPDRPGLPHRPARLLLLARRRRATGARQGAAHRPRRPVPGQTLTAMPTLTLHNTLSGRKEVFTPIDPERITLYVCGPTVYNYVHIGNARPVVAFDVLFRLLQRLYPQVVYARNITDIDDKIINAARDNGEPISALTARFTEAFEQDMAALNALPPTITPHATEHVGDMIGMIETLVDKGHAYAAEGHALFDVQSMPDYGRLSKRSLDDMLAGARVEVAPYK